MKYIRIPENHLRIRVHIVACVVCALSHNAQDIHAFLIHCAYMYASFAPLHSPHKGNRYAVHRQLNDVSMGGITSGRGKDAVKYCDEDPQVWMDRCFLWVFLRFDF